MSCADVPLPWMGGYLSPDAEYAADVPSTAGAQAYAYASGRPLVLVDPDGRYARVCKECSRVEIEMPFTFDNQLAPTAWSTPTEQVSSVKQSITSTWNQNVGEFQVRFVLREGPQNTMRLVRASMFTETCGHTSSGTRSWVSFASGALECPNSPAHEIGHMLGLEAGGVGHNPSPTNLMHANATASALNELQIRTVLARANVRGCGCGTIP